ncbi:hypothetical protein E0H88_01985 [Acinetobacter sp. ANC 4216]|nr:hypothetical protein E0H88_01985 [Acinetobacter sp. ANC 4216]
MPKISPTTLKLTNRKNRIFKHQRPMGLSFL